MLNRNSSLVQKKRELFFFEEFASKAGFDVEVLEQREAPDLIVKTCGQRIGVEITEFFFSMESHGGSVQAQESIADQIVRRAQQLYQQSGAPPAHVSLCFGPGRDLRSLNRHNTARALAEYIRSLNLSEWQRVDWRPSSGTAALPNEISFVHALGVPSFEMAHWGVVRAGWVAPLMPDALQPRVDAKAGRLDCYREAIGDVWLLIVADFGRPSALVEVRADFDPTAVSSPFDRTYFFQPPDTIIELGCIRSRKSRFKNNDA